MVARVLGQSRRVEVRNRSGERDLVRHAGGLEAFQPEAAHLDRVVDQRVVVGRAVAAETVSGRAGFRQRRRDPPVAKRAAGRRCEIDLVRLAVAAVDPDEDAGAVEEPVRFVEMRRAHRRVPGVHPIPEAERPAARRRAPAVLVDLVDRDRRSAAVGGQRDDVARELADHVAAGNPGGQREALAVGVGRGDSARHLEVVAARVDRHDPVMDRGGDRRPGRTARAGGRGSVGDACSIDSFGSVRRRGVDARAVVRAQAHDAGRRRATGERKVVRRVDVAEDARVAALDQPYFVSLQQHARAEVTVERREFLAERARECDRVPAASVERRGDDRRSARTDAIVAERGGDRADAARLDERHVPERDQPPARSWKRLAHRGDADRDRRAHAVFRACIADQPHRQVGQRRFEQRAARRNDDGDLVECVAERACGRVHDRLSPGKPGEQLVATAASVEATTEAGRQQQSDDDAVGGRSGHPQRSSPTGSAARIIGHPAFRSWRPSNRRAMRRASTPTFPDRAIRAAGRRPGCPPA